MELVYQRSTTIFFTKLCLKSRINRRIILPINRFGGYFPINRLIPILDKGSPVGAV